MLNFLNFGWIKEVDGVKEFHYLGLAPACLGPEIEDIMFSVPNCRIILNGRVIFS